MGKALARAAVLEYNIKKKNNRKLCEVYYGYKTRSAAKTL